MIIIQLILYCFLFTCMVRFAVGGERLTDYILPQAGAGEGNRNRINNAGCHEQKKKAFYGSVLYCDVGCTFTDSWILEQCYGF